MVNIQPICTVPNVQKAGRADVAPPAVMSFSLSRERNFALFPSYAISRVLQHPGAGVAVEYDTHLDRLSSIVALEVSLEKALRDEIANRRYERGLYSNFDENLSTILQVSL